MSDRSDQPAGSIEIAQIGVVRSTIRELDEMPPAGAPASIYVLPQFRPALVDIQSNTHLIILAWLDRADREKLQTLGQRVSTDRQPRGVFGLRSSSRPNPIGLTAARLLSVEGDLLRLERLDFVDGTPVIDIKRYSPGWDSIFSARTDRDLRPPKQWSKDEPADMFLMGAHFHGERCVGLALAIRALSYVTERWQIGRMHPKMIVTVGDDGCVADSLQALTGATFGSGRLRYLSGTTFSLSNRREYITFAPRGRLSTVEDISKAQYADLFDVSIDTG